MDEMATIHRAREAIARGDLGMARQLLAGLLHEQPGSETAWMMMATLVDQPDRKRDCLARVLRINPGNDVARLELEALEVEPGATPPPDTEPAAQAVPAPEAVPAVETKEAAPQPALEVEPEATPPPEPEPTETAPEAALAAEAPEALPGPAPVSDEDATVLGNSLLIDSLAPGERVLHRTTLTPWVLLSPLAAVVAAVIVVSLPGGSLPEGLVLAYRAGLLALAFAYFGLRALRYFGSEYLVTDRRVLATRGLLARQRVDIPLREIEEVTGGRASTRSGSLWIRRSDGPRVMFWRIREPGVFRDAIERARAAGSEARSF